MRVVLRELRLLCWSWDSVLELVRLVEAMEPNGELETCGLSMELGLWLSRMLCKYECTLLGTIDSSLVLCMVGGVVVGVFTHICCGGVYGALELGGALASCGLRLRLKLQL